MSLETPSPPPATAPSPQARINEGDIALLGPTKAGKTSLLASLLFAERGLHSFHKARVNFLEDDASKGAFTRQEVEGFIRREGSIWEATSETQYTVSVTAAYMQPGFWGKKTEHKTIRTLDGAGGRQFESGADLSGRKLNYLEMARRAKGIVVCLPLTLNPTERHRYFGNLRRYIANPLHPPRPGQLFALAATMYDGLFIEYGPKALELAIQRNVAHDLLRIYLEPFHYVISWLSQMAGEDNIRIFPVSSHGFVDGNGCPNTDEKYLLLEGEDAFESWRPFMTVDPFMYLLQGDASGCKLCFTPGELGFL